MRTKGKYTVARLPSAELVLAFLNDEPGAIERVLDFYGNYIAACARSAMNRHSVWRKDLFDEQEMIQEMDIHLVKAILSIRQKIQDNTFYKQPIVVIVSPK